MFLCAFSGYVFPSTGNGLQELQCLNSNFLTSFLLLDFIKFLFEISHVICFSRAENMLLFSGSLVSICLPNTFKLLGNPAPKCNLYSVFFVDSKFFMTEHVANFSKVNFGT